MKTNLNFKDNTREAMEFCKSVFGGKLQIFTFKEFRASNDSSEDDLVMHSVLKADDIEFMASNTPKGMEYKSAAGFNMSLMGDNDEMLHRCFNKLSRGGNVTMSLAKAQ